MIRNKIKVVLCGQTKIDLDKTLKENNIKNNSNILLMTDNPMNNKIVLNINNYIIAEYQINSMNQDIQIINSYEAYKKSLKK